MDIKKTGQFIQTLRKEQNLTQKQLAQKLNCTDKAVSRWETGAGLPDTAILLELSQVLGVSVNEILMGEKFAIEKILEAPPLQTTEQIISVADQNVVEILKSSETKIKKKNKITILFYIICLIQLFSLYALPQIVSLISPTAEPIVFWLYPSIVLCFAAGLLKDKIKWLYPLFLSVLLFSAIPFSGESHLYFAIGIYAFVISLIIVALGHGVLQLIRYIKNKK